MVMKKRTLNGAEITSLLSQEQQSESRPYNNALTLWSLACCLWLAFVWHVKKCYPNL